MEHIKRHMKVFKEFREFAVKGNVIDLAVGFIIGAAFNKIVMSLVNDVLMPPLGLLLARVDFTNLFVSLNGNEYASLSQAQQAGAPTLNYGIFVNNVIGFLITALAVFLLVKFINRIKRREERSAAREAAASAPATKKCPFCFSDIRVEAVRCPNCTSELR